MHGSKIVFPIFYVLSEMFSLFYQPLCQKKRKDFSKTYLQLMTWPVNLPKSLLDLWFQLKSGGKNMKCVYLFECAFILSFT